VIGVAQQFRARLSRIIRLATLVVKGNKVAATLPSGKAGQTVLEKKNKKNADTNSGNISLYVHALGPLQPE
jgi:hypothetical protein